MTYNILRCPTLTRCAITFVQNTNIACHTGNAILGPAERAKHLNPPTPLLERSACGRCKRFLFAFHWSSFPLLQAEEDPHRGIHASSCMRGKLLYKCASTL